MPSRGSNPQPSDWLSDALQTELFGLFYTPKTKATNTYTNKQITDSKKQENTFKHHHWQHLRKATTAATTFFCILGWPWRACNKNTINVSVQMVWEQEGQVLLQQCVCPNIQDWSPSSPAGRFDHSSLNKLDTCVHRIFKRIFFICWISA